MIKRGTPPALDGFTFVDLIGEGGFADVFRYRQAMPTRQVAIKVLLESALDARTRAQFEAEANVMAQLSDHPSIVPIYDAGVSGDGRPYLVMQYCPPPSLAGRFRAERFEVPEALETMVKVAGAVESAHRAGVLHRDIKPHNILTSSYGAPMLTDFGIAGTTGDVEDDGYGLSVPWSPPEAFGESMPADPRSDVYALGATLYSLLAGRSPFEVAGAANDPATLMRRIERQPLPRVNRVDVPESLEAVLARSMAKNIVDRQPTAMALARGLQEVQNELGLQQTQIDVLDASPTAAPVRDEEHRTQIRPVQIVLPDAGIGTRLRPLVVQTEPPPAVDERTQHRPTGTARAEPVPDTVARGTAAVADRTDGSHFLPSPVDAVTEPPVATEPTRSPVLLVTGAVLALLLVAGGIGALVLGGGGDDTSDAAPTARTSAPSGDEVIGVSVLPPVNLEHTVDKTGVAFTWESGSGTAGETYLVRVGAKLDQLAPAGAPVSERTARVDVPQGSTACIEVRAVQGATTSAPLTDCEVRP